VRKSVGDRQSAGQYKRTGVRHFKVHSWPNEREMGIPGMLGIRAHEGKAPAGCPRMRRVLLVSPRFPPTNAADHQRVRMTCPYFAENGGSQSFSPWIRKPMPTLSIHF
jgi:hypothetical protein